MSERFIECHAELEDTNGHKAHFRGTVPEFICEGLKIMNKFTMIRVGDEVMIAIMTKTRDDTRDFAEAFVSMLKMVASLGG